MQPDNSLPSAAIERQTAAVRAWSELHAGGREPSRVDILKDRNASHVYRLVGAGPLESNVIAKRCLRADALAEQGIYQRVLRHLPVRSLQCYGLVQERGTPCCWLFVEDAAGVPYSPIAPEHGVLAAEWLADLHTCAQSLGRSLDLPFRGPSWYLGCLRSGRERIRRGIGNPALSDDDRAVLKAIVGLCDSAEHRWCRVEACCGMASATLVHADLHTKNIHVSADGSALLLFDWASAGWGPPAIDLSLQGIDLNFYASSVQSMWPEVRPDLLRALAAAGRIFQLVTHIDWEARGLPLRWLHRPMKHMRYYMTELTSALELAQAL
jgi:Phosphotransferase enzyme family